MIDNRSVIIIDQTIREGMQYRGLVFSADERMKILDFQEALGVDISQSAYPPAHESESSKVKKLCFKRESCKYNVHIAALSRALVDDVKQMAECGLTDFHLHTTATSDLLKKQSINHIFASLKQAVQFIRSNVTESSIEVSLLDIGKTDLDVLEKCAKYLIDTLSIDILSLPDTSGIMSPDQFFKRVKYISEIAKWKKTRIGVHCHNDMGMATANTIIGVIAGASVISVSALGIGERNGIGDLYISAKCLKDKGYNLNLKVDDINLFRKYYKYIDKICFEKTGFRLLNYNTPFFGKAMLTHVAGTHATGNFGLFSKEEYFLNVLCGKNLVKKYLKKNKIEYKEDDLKRIVTKIKDQSAEIEHSITKKDVKRIVKSLTK